MGRYRPIRLVLGSAVVALALGLGARAGGPSPAVSAAPVVLHGTVSPTGASEDLLVDHPDVGVYRLALAGVDVTTWDGAADVVIIPLGGGATEVRFSADGVPVDAGFTYTAVAR